MKRWMFIVVAVAVMLSMFGSVAFAGNGAPGGAHYNLNIIGVQHDKSADMSGNNGGRIFVGLGSKDTTVNTKIMLYNSETDADARTGFYVIDANGTDGEASFALPNPDPTNSGTTTWSVWARALGKPGGAADMTTCAYWDDPATTAVEKELVCSQGTLNLIRGKNSKFQNVTAYLAYVYAYIDGSYQRVPLFSDTLYDYFWNYDNKGLKLAQFRFFDNCFTTVPAPGPSPDFDNVTYTCTK